MQRLAASAVALTGREQPTIVAATGLIFAALSKHAPMGELKGVLESHRGGVWGEESSNGNGHPVLRSTNMRGSRVDVSDAAWRSIAPRQVEANTLRSGDILVTKSSGSGDLVGKAAIFTDPEDGHKYLFSNFILRLRPDCSIVIPDYVAWFLRSPQALCWRADAQQNAVGLRNLKTDAFLSQHLAVPRQSIQQAVVRYLDAVERQSTDTAEVELPPYLAEQRRIVAKIEALAAKIEEARGLRDSSRDGATAFLNSARVRAFNGGSTEEWRSRNRSPESASSLVARIAAMPSNGQARSRKRSPISLPDPPQVPPTWKVLTAGELQEAGLILDIQDGNHGSEYPRKTEFGSTGIPFVTALQIHDWGVEIEGAPRLARERAERLRIGFAKPGDVLLTHNASVGDVAIAPDDAQPFLIGTSVTYWRCNPKGLDRRYLAHFLRSEHFQCQLRWIMKQTTRNQVSVLKQVNLWVCLAPIDEQREVAAYLDDVQIKVDRLKALQAQTAAELDALLPSILDRAFKGEL